MSGLLLLGGLTGCGDTSAAGGGAVPSPAETAANATASSAAEATPGPSAPGGNTQTPASSALPAQVNTDGATVISLSGTSATVDGGGAAVENGVVTISKGGTYTVSGTLREGRILVDAKGAEVTLVLNGADITCSYGSPIYIYKAKLATIHLQEGTENTLTDGAAYTFADSLSSAAEEEPNACLYSKADLVIQGAGALTVNGNYNNGITSKDTLLLRDGMVTVNAANHGVNGKDSHTLEGVTLTVNCGGDAIRSTNDSDAALGWVSITNANLTLTAGEDGIQAETWCSVQGGSYTITSGGGNAAGLTDDTSAKGIKAGGSLTLLEGVFVMDCADDAFHSNADLTVSGGTYTVSTGDDAFHADETLTVEGGSIDIKTSYEGLEGSDVNLLGGTVTLVARDDGVNAAGGADGSGFMDRGGMGREIFGGGTAPDTVTAATPAARTAPGGGGGHTLTVAGGSLTVVAGGDGLDANGALVLTGGEITVCSTGMGDGGLDSDGGVTLSGGTVFAATGGSMPQAPSDPAQNTVAVGFGRSLAAGSRLTFSCGDKSWTYTLSGQANSVVFSAPELAGGGEMTVTCDGETLAEFTLSEGLTTSGQMSGMGMQGGKGGMGGHTGWQQFGTTRPEGDLPDRGQMPQGQEGFGDRVAGGRGGRGEAPAPAQT